MAVPARSILSLLPPRLRDAAVALLAYLVGALLVYGGVRLAQQQAWGWGALVGLAGVLMIANTIRSQRRASAESQEPGVSAAAPPDSGSARPRGAKPGPGRR